ncbi:MAG: hypothetical protein NDF57_07715 [archaeon GBS-70-058]|nr:hypothetical protein [Candidatus Culexarchaeum nevadense]
MKRIIRGIKRILSEEAYCSNCDRFVKVDVKVKTYGNRRIEIKKCSICGRVIEEREYYTEI